MLFMQPDSHNWPIFQYYEPHSTIAIVLVPSFLSLKLNQLLASAGIGKTNPPPACGGYKSPAYWSQMGQRLAPIFAIVPLNQIT
jgi:hypothetical protein